jgi:peptide chain release factor 1
LQISGKKARQIFKNESGGHRWQRIPETEKRGRVQTSTITIAVLDIPQAHEYKLDDRDLEITTRRGSGPGGQHKNKTDSCVDIKHKPTGITVTVDGRKQHQNKALALQILRAKILAQERERGILERNRNRRQQVGLGMRGDKRRTIRVNDNQVIDHVLGRTTSFKEYSKGNFDNIIR